MTLPSITGAVAARILAVLLLAAVAWGVSAEIRVANLRTEKAQAETALQAEKRDRSDAARMAETSARQTEAILRSDIETLTASAAMEKRNAQAREDDLLGRVRTGERRLSIAARCPAGGGQAASDPGPSVGSGAAPSRAELDPAAAERILRITLDGDQAIRERNLCIESYEVIRARINKGEEKEPAP